MTADADMRTIVDALGLPPDARVDARVPKKLLVEQGAPTTADKRAIQDGIDELQWFAACKPTTIGVPAFSDDTREYLEIAIVGCALRPGAKSARLVELIHRAIPYPVLLITTDAGGATLSAAHKRKAQNEAGRVVIELLVVAEGLRAQNSDATQAAFFESLSLALQPRSNLYALYAGWFARIEALSAARLTGHFEVSDDTDVVRRRRDALAAHAGLVKEIDALRSGAKREKQLSRRVDLNMKMQRLTAQLGQLVRDL